MALTKRAASGSSTAIQQIMTSGLAFDGVLPADGSNTPIDSPLVNNSIYKYAGGAHGGLFFWNSNEPLVCSQLHVALGGSGTISVYIVNLDPTALTPLAGESILIEQATGVSFLALDESKFKVVLMPYQGLQLITTAVSGQPQIAQCIASSERLHIR